MLLTPGRLTLGIVLPIQTSHTHDFNYPSQIAIARKADELGFDALWVRDVPLNSDSYPDPVGHSDPWVLLGALAMATTNIQLVTGAIVLPLRNPLHIAKAALSVGALSGGRFVLGLGSGDRPSEFAVFGEEFDRRKEIFRSNWRRLAAALGPDGEVLDGDGRVQVEFSIRPLRAESAIPFLSVGSASQSLEWIARTAAGWATYYRPLAAQADRIALWKTAIGKVTTDFRSFSQSMVLELVDDPDASTEPLGLGIRTGRKGLIRYLDEIGNLGANHVMLNIVPRTRSVDEVLQEIAEDVLPDINNSKAEAMI
ncbi:TIGR03571 family LLM class oxidoreductase [Rhizobium sp. L51/94]|uniref:TIGR03571 family LLM class oxidoreductase n=1 Tax=Rhizobium sp. L51/94 TaxID=2819999 RepID=UPI001C5AC145|nr:TIGR03571 family LLM class oxidoreductase [Rhizobium sp. L51/94]QXZ80778.1 TIGR03571 family LLM class oxidoreductase [Rhizobium sp. L51/94]